MPGKAQHCKNPNCSYLLENKSHLPKRLGVNDIHGLCIRSLGVDHNATKCEICKLFNYKTLKQRFQAIEHFKVKGVWPDKVNAKSLDKERLREKSSSRSSPAPQDRKKASLIEGLSTVAQAYKDKGLKVLKVKSSTKQDPPPKELPVKDIPVPPPMEESLSVTILPSKDKEMQDEGEGEGGDQSSVDYEYCHEVGDTIARNVDDSSENLESPVEEEHLEEEEVDQYEGNRIHCQPSY